MNWLERGGVRLAYEDVGRGAPPLLLVHDLGSDHTFFAEEIARRRWTNRVIAVDLRGHGQSGGSSEGHSIAEMADDLAWLCCELGIFRPIVVGQGLGNLVAHDLSTRYPDLTSDVASLGSLGG